MTSNKSYTEAMTALVTFVADVARDTKDPVQQEKAATVLADFVFAALVEATTKK